MSISQKQVSFVRSLQQKKFREEERLFVAEGVKVVKELLQSSFTVRSIIATSEFLSSSERWVANGRFEILEAKEKELERMSSLSTPQEVMAVAEIPNVPLDVQMLTGGMTVFLDDVRDPGNLGTILRIAHWFGVRQVVCSLNSVDAYNPKVVQASMGSLFHVPVHYIGLEGLLSQLKSETTLPVYAAVMDGEDIYNSKLSREGVIIFGNESTGIRSSLVGMSSKKISIPSFEQVTGNRPESLNVAVSAAVMLAEFNVQAASNRHA